MASRCPRRSGRSRGGRTERRRGRAPGRGFGLAGRAVACPRKLSAANMDGDLNRDQLLLRLTRWALALTAAASPLYVVRWHVGPLPTTTLELLILATLGLYALLLILRRGPLPRRSPYEIPIALMLLAGLIGIFVATDHRGALGIFRAYLVEPMAMYYVALAVLTFEVLEPVLAVIGAGAVVFSAAQIETFVAVLHRGHLNP